MGRLIPALTAVLSGAITVSASHSASYYHPDIKSAHDNAFAIFNSIHSAMRQWGSSVHHNGLSFYLATAPEGSVFYHGGYSTERPDSFEWLAFEIEHAAQFAASWEFTQSADLNTMADTALDAQILKTLLRHRSSHARPPSDPGRSPNLHNKLSSQRPLGIVENNDEGDEDDDDDDEDPPTRPPRFDKLRRGYLQLYRANRPLNLLYIDGEAAAKCPLGSLDSQDLILLGRNKSSGPPTWGEWPRAKQLCALADEWKHPTGAKIDGFIRMEAGFEIVYCDFSEQGGLDLVSVQGSSFRNETGLPPHQIDSVFEWLRASAARFHGHPAGRLDIDWSSMVSAFSYPMNLSNPDWHRQDLPRVVNATMESRLGVRARLRDVFAARGGQEVPKRRIVNWQGVVDKIVTRFSERLQYMANNQWTHDRLLLALGTIVDPHISYTDHSPMSEHLAIDRCTQHYLDPSFLHPETWTPEDHAVATALERVSHTICDTLFHARRVLRAANGMMSSDSDALVKEAQRTIVELMEQLRWTTWRECDGCASSDEICSIPMFPTGASENDYFHPSCKNITEILRSFGYWGLDVHIYDQRTDKRA
ncbi:hypothetical protein J7T55_005896 [Diaporthe amygdali]|uniref:uncharacterized protein n=1 Tax=Phomopsis amygdali TaxID=1214568 RepID=UPI0022FE8ACE|nr:uncharacterized protein J7T55_005896 [Diaporthe amygdali]KAJ0124558.1 hypothetical protein J7T55_005896 [Diaporthe amygdali]